MTTARLPTALVLVSHPLCPYVQRAAIVLAEKNVTFERRDVDLADKPAWFLAVSPLGRTPVLLADETPVFESAAICEYLDETLAPRLHPVDALARARHRGWIECASTVLDRIAGFYNAADDTALAARRDDIAALFGRVEAALVPTGPYFSGPEFRLVDAAFAPVFRYFDVFDRIEDFRVFDSLPRTRAWREALARRPSVRDAVDDGYPTRLEAFLRRRDRALSRRMRHAS